MKLSIVIPAYNEEASIGSVIQRTLEARKHLVDTTPVDEVLVTVVSDGSTDRTVEIASRFADQIHLVVFEANRGYGAAIKQGWEESTAELLGFLDGDGTCNPLFFTDLVRIIVDDQADVALGSRLGKSSRIPLIRRFGNLFFSFLLSFFAEERVRDTASGMRVVRRSALPDLLPLPDGLNFTPAMSARAVLSGGVTIREKEMEYREREGESKLHVIKDGLRFLGTILRTALLYTPNTILKLAGIVCGCIAVGLMIVPARYYLAYQSVLEWMVYRFILAQMSAILCCLFFCAGYLSERIVSITLFEDTALQPQGLVNRLITSRFNIVLLIASLIAGAALVYDSFVDRVVTGQTFEHWSRYIGMTTIYTIAFTIIVTKIIDHLVSMIHARMTFMREQKTRRPEENG